MKRVLSAALVVAALAGASAAPANAAAYRQCSPKQDPYQWAQNVTSRNVGCPSARSWAYGAAQHIPQRCFRNGCVFLYRRHRVRAWWVKRRIELEVRGVAGHGRVVRFQITDFC